MWEGAIMIAASCVLYISMGLHDAIVRVTGIDLKITGCPKCCTYWSVLLWGIIKTHDIVLSVFAAFSLAYGALWATLLLDALSTIYNRLYEKLTTTNTEGSAAETTEADNP